MSLPNIPYSISSSTIEDIKMELNAILASISDRLDAMDGSRGYGVVKSRLDIVDSNNNRIHGFTNEPL